MAAGDVVQVVTSTSGGTAVASLNTGVLTAPVAGDTDIICACSNQTILTPSGYTLDVKNELNQGMYVFRKTFGASPSGAAVTVSVSSGNFPMSLTRMQLSATATLNASDQGYYNATTTSARSTFAAITTTATTGILMFGADENASGSTGNWTTFSPNAIAQQAVNASAGSSNTMLAYGNGITSGTFNCTAVEGFSTQYQLLTAAYTFSGGGGGSGPTTQAILAPSRAAIQASAW